ncbi:XdhC family protein, partial [Acinetobacter baumannii]|uniref:XdhC family protein n=1 Tax=Acinetobacter baumannii TaxID=470 RepID=UPI0006173345
CCLLPIGVRVKWIDPRDDIFPSDLLEQAYCITTDTLDAEIEHFDRSGAVLILTHDHQLDLQLCFTALKPTAKPFAYVGMIGSKSKRAIFEKRMQVRGYTSETLQRLVCPIGIEGISSKQPAMIAIAVVAQLLQVFDVKK